MRFSNLQYRAFGGMKHATYGNNVQADLTYNSRMQIGQYQVAGPGFTRGATMNYYADGRTNTAFDLNDSRFDRKYEFDFSARLKEAYSGVEAHGQSAPPLNQANSPYRQSYTYDEYNNATLRSGRIWSTQSEYDAASYTNDNKNGSWGYDAAGNATFTGYSGDGGTRTYDAAGRPVTYTSSQNWQVYPNWPSNHPDAPALETQDTFDGTGQVVKHINHTRTDQSSSDPDGENIVYWMDDTTTTTYYVHSTVLGGKTIAELDQNGAKTTGYVYAGGARLATQTVYGSSNSTQIESTNPVTGAAFTTDVNGNGASRQEPDPLGRDLTNPPDPTVPVEPLALARGSEPMPIEYTGGPSHDALDSLAAWGAVMAEQTWQYQHGYFDKGGYFDIKNQFINAVVNQRFGDAAQILAKNPNFFIELDGRMTAGQDASSSFMTALAKLPGDPLGMGQNTDFAAGGGAGTQRAASTQSPHQDFKNFLQTMSQDCKDALSGLAGNVLGKLANLANTAQIYDVNSLQSVRASRYVDGFAKGRETLGTWFDRETPSGGAYTAVHIPRSGIYIRGGEGAFAGKLYLELHEMTHLAYNNTRVDTNLDRYLARGLGLTRGSGEDWSTAVSRFFSSKCTKKGP